MKIHLDFEFIEDGRNIYPLSIGLVSKDDREYYAEFAEAPLRKANDWVKEHVFPYLKSLSIGISLDYLVPHDMPNDPLAPEFRAKYTEEIKKEILEFVGDSPEFWGYFCDYDWVIMSQLYGAMIELPDSWPKYCLDVKQEMHMNNISKEQIELVYPQPTTHNSLDDARWIKFAREYVSANG